MAKLYPGAVWRPVPSHGGLMLDHLGLVLHVQVGNNSCYGEFSNPANQASSTWWVSKTGVVEQYVDADYAAWTEAAGNYTWDSVETEGDPSEPLTDAQMLAVAGIYMWGRLTYGWPPLLSNSPTERGLGWHGMGGKAWGGHYGCPGDLRRGQRAAILYLAGADGPQQPVSQPEDDMVRLMKGDKDTDDGAIKAGTVFVVDADLGWRVPAPNEAWLADAAGILDKRILPPPQGRTTVQVAGLTVEVIGSEVLRPVPVA